ncbi:MAG: LacI family DNA-binding transcriptional regulator [Clostridia bacterium]|nr:LacI family DNA-binding transcriptional regulator [Clostridia bacterium]
MATLKELAAYTGVSAAAISRILNNDPTMSVSEGTRARVLEAAGKLNYAATKSRKGRSLKCMLRIGLAEMLSPVEQLDDPYYLYLKSFVGEECAARKIEVSALHRNEDGFAYVGEAALDGIIAIGIFTRGQIASLRALSDNVVFLDSSPDELHSDSVVINFRLGIETALSHLFAIGHTRIGFIGPAEKLDDWKQPAPELRRTLFIRYMRQRGAYDAHYLLTAPMNAGATAAQMHTHIEKGAPLPTAYLTANEENAIGAVRALRESGLRVPEDVSIISFNDTPLSELIEPPLTSISTHLREMCATAVRLVTERAPARGREQRVLPQKVVIPPALVLRDSVAPPADCIKSEMQNG